MLNAPTTHSIFASPRTATEIVSSMREPFAVFDGDLCLVTASPAFFTRFRLDPFVNVGKPVFDLGDGEWDTLGTHELFRSIAPTRDSVEDFQLEIRSPGSERPRVTTSVRPVRSGANQIDCYLCGFYDMEPIKERSDRDLLQRMRRQSADVFGLVEVATGRIALVEGGARQLTGYTAGELAGLRIDKILHPGDRQVALAQIEEARGDGQHIRTSFRIRHRDGRELWVDAHCDGCTGDGGEEFIHISLRDVSDRKRAEESLRWVSRQVKTILDSAADGIFGIDMAGRITFINPVAARIAGCRVTELLGRNYFEIFAPDGGDRIDVIGATLADGLGRQVRETTVRCSDGRRIPIELSCNISRERGETVGAVVVFRGIEERKRAEESARKAEWLAGVGETTVAVRHEINNPLTSLLAEVRLLEMGGNTKAEEMEMIQSICDDARRIAGVIRRLSEQQTEPTVRIEGDLRMLDLRV